MTLLKAIIFLLTIVRYNKELIERNLEEVIIILEIFFFFGAVKDTDSSKKLSNCKLLYSYEVSAVKKDFTSESKNLHSQYV